MGIAAPDLTRQMGERDDIDNNENHVVTIHARPLMKSIVRKANSHTVPNTDHRQGEFEFTAAVPVTCLCLAWNSG